MFVERHLPQGFSYRGNRPRRPSRVGGGAASKRQPGGRSLDSFKQHATSEKNGQSPTMAAYLKEKTDARDKRRRALSLHEALMDTLKGMTLHEEADKRLRASDEATGAVPLSTPTQIRRRRREWSPSKDWERLSGCQTEWMGYRAACCGGQAVAVPIGCNHRLCPLCNAHRAERYRVRVQTLFHELSNPQLLTLTVPSPREMSRKVIDTLRTRLKAFLKENRALLLGGVYSIEIPYNKTAKSWHPHVHVLVDVNDPREKLPYAEFVDRKRRLEFSWLVLTQGRRLEGETKWRNGDYEQWKNEVASRSVGLVAGGGRNRRIVDLRPVTKDRKAAYEVLKYMSKAASFIGDAYALRQLLTAIRGVRQIQTFGSCYNFTFAEESPSSGSQLQCACGEKRFERIGVLGLGMVTLRPDGTWLVRKDAPGYGRQRCRGSST